MDLYKEWTHKQPHSNFADMYSSGDQSGVADVSTGNNARLTYSRRASNKSDQGGQGAGKSCGGGGRGSGAGDDEDEIYPNDSLTSVRPPPFPPSPALAPAPVHSHAGSKTTTKCDTDSKDRSTMFVGVVDHKTSMDVSVGLGEKVDILSPFSFLAPGTI